MRKIAIIIGVITFALYSCNKATEVVDQEAVDEEIILNYIEKTGLDATKHISGLYYVINDPGIGGHPTTSSRVKVNYKGYLTDSTEFDSGVLDYYLLSGLIRGWQYGLPLIGLGGDITLILPSDLGYGSTAAGDIPANSVLIFEIELLDFK